MLCWCRHKKNMYLKTPLDWFEYVKIPIALLPNNTIEHYQLWEKFLDGYVYMEIRKGMYWLSQASILANKLLKEQLAHHGYFEQPHTLGWNMSLARCDSTYVWTILVLNTLEENIFNIYMMHYEKKHMKLWKIGQATYIAELQWNGTTMWILLCQHMSWNNSQNTVRLPPWNHSIARMHPIPSNTA